MRLQPQAGVIRSVATLRTASLASMLPPAGPRYHLSRVLPVVLRGWLIEAKRIGRTGLYIWFDGDHIELVEPQDVPASDEPTWSADLTSVIVPISVNLECAAADLRAIGQALKAHEKARAHWA